MKYAYATLSLAAIAVAQITHQVQIGPGLSYSPDTLTAAEGDVVQFTFGSGHDVVSGPVDSACEPDGIIASGQGNNGEVFSVTINSTDPLWLYCSVPRHCQGGMVMVINPPSEGNTLDDYRSAASSSSGSTTPDGVLGGVYGAVSAEDSSSASSDSTAAATTSATESSSPSATESSTEASESAASSSGSASSSAATAAATSEGAGGSEDAAGNVMAPLSFVLAAVAGGVALMI